MKTKEKLQVDMLKGLALVEYEDRVQRNLLIPPKLCANMGCVLVLPLEIRTPSIVWGLMTPYSIPS